ncbi:MAG: hypothetical protein KJ767_01965 [Nanoarchaeota archaeon]|nr:hypothetical protein [Nanoarchaeota archaeon]
MEISRLEKFITSYRFIMFLGVSLISLAALGTGVQIYSTIQASKPQQPVYRDVNNDGIEDKIIMEKKLYPGFLFSHFYGLEEKTYFGFEVDGKRIYLTEEQFEETKK